MTTLHRAYTSTHDAENAVERLLSAGVTRIELIMGHAVEDARDAPIGTFAGTTTEHDQLVGSYANLSHSGRAAIGTFAGDPDRQRRGSFGDVDRDTVTSYRAGVKRTRITSHHALEKILVGAGLDRAIARANVLALHAGHVLVLVGRESAKLTRHPLLRRTAAGGLALGLSGCSQGRASPPPGRRTRRTCRKASARRSPAGSSTPAGCASTSSSAATDRRCCSCTAGPRTGTSTGR
jgi:hypothetical protein